MKQVLDAILQNKFILPIFRRHWVENDLECFARNGGEMEIQNFQHPVNKDIILARMYAVPFDIMLNIVQESSGTRYS